MTKEKISVSIDTKLLKWIDKQVEDGTFANRSHALVFFVNFGKKHKIEYTFAISQNEKSGSHLQYV